MKSIADMAPRLAGALGLSLQMVSGRACRMKMLPPEGRSLSMAGSPLAAAWLGHATVLLRLGGLTVLTDPVFSDRIGPRVAGRTVGVPRQAPWGGGDEGGAFRERPDVILISHAHFDHLDRPTLQALAAPAAQGRAAATPPIVITARGTRRLIPRGFTRVIELDWHESVDHRGVLFTAYRPRHWGARTLWDRHRGFNSYLIESARPVPGTGVERVFFAGDTALTHAFDGMEAALAIFGIGAYEPWIHAHANPEQVWAMFSAMRARWLMPIHHSTFQLGDEHPDEPLARLLRAAGPEAGRIVGRSPGEVFVSRMP